jgi:cytochrome c-type biogenesis protein CcmF
MLSIFKTRYSRRLFYAFYAKSGITFAHVAVALSFLAMIFSTWGEIEKIQIMFPGDYIRIANYVITFVGVDHIEGSTYHSVSGCFLISNQIILDFYKTFINISNLSNLDFLNKDFILDKDILAVLFPEKRFYYVNEIFSTKTAIFSSFWGDVSVLIGDGNLANGWYVKVNYKPLMPLLWLSGLFMTLGGFISVIKYYKNSFSYNVFSRRDFF